METDSLIASLPMNLGITRAGGRIHRLSDADPLYSPCGQYLHRKFVKTPLEVSAPLCESCFDADENLRDDGMRTELSIP